MTKIRNYGQNSFGHLEIEEQNLFGVCNLGFGI
jgi:hypothetical protein